MKLFRKKEVLVPTFKGSILLLLLFAGLLLAAGAGLYPFLAQNNPLPDADVAIIEGWMSDAELVSVLSGLPDGTVCVATGGPIYFASDLFQERTYAELMASRLIKLGVMEENIVVASAPDTSADRTYVSALAARRIMEAEGIFGRPANIYTVGAHGRRSFLLYHYAFGSDALLGVVSIENLEVDLRRWWSSSAAFKSICTELLSLMYTHCTRWKYD